MSTSTNAPESITIGPGIEMTFLRDNKYLTRTVVSAKPGDDLFVVPAHWHETHDEFIRVVEGQVEITIGAITRIYTPEDGDAHIPRGVAHSLKGLKGVPIILEERTDPMDSEKELLFRNMASQGKMTTNFLELMNIFYYGDGYPVLPGHFKPLERAMTLIFGYYVAPLFGCERKYKTFKDL